jgi:hypothetical protein
MTVRVSGRLKARELVPIRIHADNGSEAGVQPIRRRHVKGWTNQQPGRAQGDVCVLTPAKKTTSRNIIILGLGQEKKQKHSTRVHHTTSTKLTEYRVH